MSFHFPNHPSNQSVKGSLMPEFSANSLANVVSPCRALVRVPSGAVLFGIKVHFPPKITQTPPFPECYSVFPGHPAGSI